MSRRGRESPSIVTVADQPRTDLIGEVLDLVNATEMASIGAVDTTRADVESMLFGADADPELSLLARTDDGLEAVLLAERFPDLREVYFDLHLRPGRPIDLAGILVADLLARSNAALSQWPPQPTGESASGFDADSDRESGMAAVAALGSEQDLIWQPNPQVWQALTAVYAEEVAAAGLLRQHGFRWARRFSRMVLDFDEPPAPDPAPPAGIRLRRAETEADLRTVHAVDRAAFADHWGDGERTFEAWLASHQAAGHDPAGWFIAMAEDQAVGFVGLDDSRAEFNRGYVNSLGVLRPARGRGVATWLLRVGFAYAAARGYSGCELGVDSASPTGADHLYRKVGMRPTLQTDAYIRPLSTALLARGPA